MNRIIYTIYILLFLTNLSRAQYLINSSGSTLIASANARIIAQNTNITNNGAMELNTTSNVELTGTLLETISGSNEITFGNLEINNSGNVTIDKTINVATVLNFNLGKFLTSSTKLVTFNAGSSYSNVKNTSYVQGPAKKIGSSDFEFPIGKNGSFRKSGIYSLSGSESFTSEYFNTPYSDLTCTGANLNHVSVVEYWTLTRLGTETATVLLSWDSNSAVESGFESDLVVAKYNGTDWISNGGNAFTGNYSAGTLKSDAARNAFDFFTLGSKTIKNPLPISLTSFDVNCNEKNVEINWSTSSEFNNNYFTIEKSNDGVTYNFLTNVDAVGYSTDLNYYSVNDNVSKNSYYRLKQTDFDGNFKYFKSEFANCNSNIENKSINIYKNNDYLHLEFTSENEDNYIISIYNLNGQLIKSYEGKTNIGENKIEINISKFNKNLYLLNFYSSNQIFKQKLNL